MIQSMGCCGLLFSMALAGADPIPEAKKAHVEAFWRLYQGPRPAQPRPRRAPEALPRMAPNALVPTIPATPWVELGPTRVAVPDTASATTAGRILQVHPHPTKPGTLYVVSDGGGLFKCTNADRGPDVTWNWQNMVDQLPHERGLGNLNVGAMAFSPSDPETLFISLGVQRFLGAMGYGFYISRDGGQTWSEGGTLGASRETRSLVALDDQTILVGTDQGLFHSRDGGKSFTQHAQFQGQSHSIRMLARLGDNLVCESEDGTVGDFWFSSDQGQSWQKAAVDETIKRLRPVWCFFGASRASQRIGYATFLSLVSDMPRGILKTLDAGRSWQFIAAGNGPEDLFNGGYEDSGYNIVVDPDDPDRLIVGGVYPIYRSVDGGKTWTWLTDPEEYTHADFGGCAWSRSGPKTLYVGSDGGLNVYTHGWYADSGQARAKPTYMANVGLNNLMCYTIGSTTAATPEDARSRVTTGTQDNSTLVREGNSLRWTQRIGGDGTGTVIHPLDGAKMLGSIQWMGGIYRSTNGGVDWAPAKGGIVERYDPQKSPFLIPLTLDRTDATGNTVYTCSYRQVYRTKDFATTWKPLPSVPPNSERILTVSPSPSAPGVVAVCTRGSVSGRPGWLTEDDGVTWTPMGSVETGAYSSWIEFDPKDSRTLYVSSASLEPTAHHLWVSRDRGRSWQFLDGTLTAPNGFPFGLPVYKVMVDPLDTNVLYACSELGVYASSDRGTTWYRLGSGLPRVQTRDMYVAPDGTFLRVATMGRGIWEFPFPPMVSSISLQASASWVPAGRALAFQAKALARGGASDALTWRCSAGSISSTGILTAPNTPGPVTVTVQSQFQPSVQASLEVTVVGSGDVNGDGVVDVLDLAWMASAFGKAGACDLNGDGRIDDTDIALLVAQLETP